MILSLILISLVSAVAEAPQPEELLTCQLVAQLEHIKSLEQSQLRSGYYQSEFSYDIEDEVWSNDGVRMPLLEGANFFATEHKDGGVLFLVSAQNHELEKVADVIRYLPEFNLEDRDEGEKPIYKVEIAIPKEKAYLSASGSHRVLGFKAECFFHPKIEPINLASR